MIPIIIINSCIILFAMFYVLTYLLQLNRYEIKITINTCYQHIIKLIAVCLLFDCLQIVCNLLLFKDLILVYILSLIIIIISRVIASICYIKSLLRRGKLKFTYRVIRFLIIYISFLIAISWICYNYISIFLSLFTLIAFGVYLLSFCVSKLIEYLISLKYIYATKRKLTKYKNMKVIAITGSYGKTSTKLILTHILKSKYIVECTPKSYNTPMGICRFILSANLSNVEFLVVEMGAVRRGDILKLCKMLSPDFGIITSIGLQHLDTFGSIENIIKTKNELSDYLLKYNKKVIYNINNNFCSDLFFDKYNSNKYAVCVNKYNDVDKYNYKYDIKYSNNVKFVSIDNISIFGTKFNYYNICNKNGVYLSTKLLGESFVVDISLAVCMAEILEVENRLIVERVASLSYIDNRMELRRGLNGANIIFDAYNSNEYSFKEMIKLVENLNAKNKLLITPGVVELSCIQESVNKELSRLASNVFDEIWVVNKVNKYAFIEGSKNNLKCVYKYFDKLDRNIFDKINLLDNDWLVVIENDLPDIYL